MAKILAFARLSPLRDEDEDQDSQTLPPLQEGQRVPLKARPPEGKKTSPLSRYTEAPQVQAAGQAFRDAGIRVLMHPEQFIVLNSERPEVRTSSARTLAAHADTLDRFGFERSTWNLLLLHGGKGGRAAELAGIIPDLPDAVRLRLGLENDERAYGPAELLPVCEGTGVPFVFDAHHHVVRERLPDQEDPSVREWVLAARRTWQPPEWQVVHLSNGLEGPQDRRHSYLIAQLPAAYWDVPWIEVEAKGKEEAVAALMEGSGGARMAAHATPATLNS